MRLQPTKSQAAALSARFRIFVTDYDGTLLRDDKKIHPQDLTSLHRLRAGGVTTAIATGRSLYSFNRSLDVMSLAVEDLGVDYLVFSTGAGIMDLRTGNIVRSLDLGGEEITRTCLYFNGRGFDYMIHRPIPDTPHFLYKTHGRANPDFHARIALYPDFGSPLVPGSDISSRATEVLAIVPREQMTLSRAAVQSVLEGTSVIFATSPLDHRSVWIEVFHRDASKSQAMAWLAKQLGAGPHEVVAVGNDYNDLDLLQWSGLSCLVENGPEELWAECVMVPSNNHCGVSHAARVAGLLG